MAVPARVSAVVKCDVFTAVFADQPAHAIFAAAGEWRLFVTCIDVSGMYPLHHVRGNDLLTVKLAIIDMQIDPPSKVRDARKDAARLLHIVVLLFDRGADNGCG